MLFSKENFPPKLITNISKTSLIGAKQTFEKNRAKTRNGSALGDNMGYMISSVLASSPNVKQFHPSNGSQEQIFASNLNQKQMHGSQSRVMNFQKIYQS